MLHLEKKIGKNPEYAISKGDIEAWEEIHGKIPPGSIFFTHTGWDRHWNTKAFNSEDENGVCHFPGYSGPAAELLITRQVNCVGIDTTSIDVGISTEFPAHTALLKENIFLIENLANLDQLPPTGANVWILPMKIKNAPESPIRAVATLS